MDRRQDPRNIVTPYAFSVHPDLLGRSLATPAQRLYAIGVDFVIIMGLSRIWGGPTLAIASGILLLWLAVRKPGRDVFGKLFRASVGCLGIMVLSITLVFIWLVRLDGLDDIIGGLPESRDSVGIEVDGDPAALSLTGLLQSGRDLRDLPNAEDGAEAKEIAGRIAVAGRGAGISSRDIRSELRDLMPSDAPWSGESEAIVDEVMADLRARTTDVAEMDPDAPPPTIAAAAISDSLALDSIQALNSLIEELEDDQEDTEAELERLQREESRGFLDWLSDLLDDTILGFGWGALYLTIAHVVGKGTTIGKKIFKIRVVMIDKRPLNWWLSFERTGGYAAGFATGLLGFFQIFWDPNRQAIHDKVSETIVLQDDKAPVPGPWMAEGRAKWEEARRSPSDA